LARPELRLTMKVRVSRLVETSALEAGLLVIPLKTCGDAFLLVSGTALVFPKSAAVSLCDRSTIASNLSLVFTGGGLFVTIWTPRTTTNCLLPSCLDFRRGAQCRHDLPPKPLR